MKKRLLGYGALLVLCSSLLLGCDKAKDKEEEVTPAETPLMASKEPANRVAVLEDFTGVRCQYCPDGHDRAKAAQEQLGKDKFIILAVHGGQYATPASGWANFTTAYADALISQAKVTGYPAGTINRALATSLGVPAQFTGGGGLAMSRGSWATAAAKINQMPSPVNVGAAATFNSQTRELTVNMDMYYTSDETNANNINVAFVQNKLMSKQSNQGGTVNSYEQNHVLRNLITGQWGESVTDAKTQGSIVRKTYTYSVPNDYHGTNTEGGGAVVIENCSVVVFIARGNSDILTAVEVPITVK